MMAHVGPRFTYTPFLVAVILTCWYGGLGPALLATVLGLLIGGHYATDLAASRPGGYLVVSVIIAVAMNAQRRAKLRLEAETAERMRLEEEEKRERQWSHITLASIGDAVITTDSEGRVNFMNGVAESLTGWSLADAMGKPLAEVFHIVNEETRAPVENPVERVLREGVIVGLANHTSLVRRDGSLIPIDDSGAPVRDEQKGTIGAVLVFRDVAERRAALREIQDSQAETGTGAGRGPHGHLGLGNPHRESDVVGEPGANPRHGSRQLRRRVRGFPEGHASGRSRRVCLPLWSAPWPAGRPTGWSTGSCGRTAA